ncbi:MAG: DUF58 domain-containing protein [Lentisphaeria bacterium]
MATTPDRVATKPEAKADPLAFDDPGLFMAMENLELAARGIVEGAIHGMHRSPYIGFSAEFDAHREYMPGDDLRYVNWNLWGRTDRLYVKQFTSDTNLNLYLLLDISGSMLCAHGPSEKWRYGARAAAALACFSLRNRDAVGLYLLRDRVEAHVPPVIRPGQFHQILSVLGAAQPEGEVNLSKAFDDVLELCRRKGIVFLISDMLTNEDDILRGLVDLRVRGHDVTLLHLLDPWEADLPEHGQYEFTDLESGDRVFAHVDAVRQTYNDVVDRWRTGLERRCQQHGIDWVTCTTADPLQDIMVDYLMRRPRL